MVTEASLVSPSGGPCFSPSACHRSIIASSSRRTSADWMQGDLVARALGGEAEASPTLTPAPV